MAEHLAPVALVTPGSEAANAQVPAYPGALLPSLDLPDEEHAEQECDGSWETYGMWREYSVRVYGTESAAKAEEGVASWLRAEADRLDGIEAETVTARAINAVKAQAVRDVAARVESGAHRPR